MTVHNASPERLLRTVDDEDADRQQTVRNLTAHAFEDWPTEAGFDGLCEERGPIEIPVVGTIPPWAAGNLYRTGPGQLKLDDTPKGTHHFSHWFDGLAHSHRFEIVAVDDDDKTCRVRVFYSSRRQSEDVARLIRRRGAGSLFSFAQHRDPCVSLLGKCMSTFRAAVWQSPSRISDSKNVNVVVLTDVPGLVGSPVPPPSSPSPLPSSPPPASAPFPTTSGHRNNLPANVWITTDANMMRQVDPATLEPIGFAVQQCLHPDLKGQFSAAHAQRDPLTGDLYNFNLELGPAATYRVFRVSAATGKTTILATIRCASSAAAGPRPAYIHSLFLTAHYVVLCIPCSHIAARGLKILWEQNIADGIVPFDPALQTRWLVIDRSRPGASGISGSSSGCSNGVIAEFVSDARFFFHSVNAYEEEEGEEQTSSDGRRATSLICDVVDFPSFDIVKTFYYDVLLNRNGAARNLYKDPAATERLIPSLSRYRLKLPRETISSSRDDDGDSHKRNSRSLIGCLSGHTNTYSSTSSTTPTPTTAPADRLWTISGPHAGELPTINPAYATHQHRFVYSICTRGLSTLADGLVKVDTESRSSLLWAAPPKDVPGEAIFVPRPRDDGGGEDEDDGVLLSVVLDGQAGTSYLLCLDARTMTELGRAEVGIAVGFGFHGTHVSGRQV